jgi:hypothetical protein
MHKYELSFVVVRNCCCSCTLDIELTLQCVLWLFHHEIERSPTVKLRRLFIHWTLLLYNLILMVTISAPLYTGNKRIATRSIH